MMAQDVYLLWVEKSILRKRYNIQNRYNIHLSDQIWKFERSNLKNGKVMFHYTKWTNY